eukprot:353362-Rhodomonas_salina.2
MEWRWRVGMESESRSMSSAVLGAADRGWGPGWSGSVHSDGHAQLQRVSALGFLVFGPGRLDSQKHA